jgi:DNA-binding HxlR family transcriptional regulator
LRHEHRFKSRRRRSVAAAAVDLAALVGGGEVDFTYLQKTLGISDGNLGTHLRKLEAEKYIRAKKVFVKRKPKTWFQITTEGRSALERLFRQLEEMLGKSK